jgi:hypothetical protein
MMRPVSRRASCRERPLREKHFQERSVELQIPPLRSASVGMTKGRDALPLRFDVRDDEQQVPPLRSPGFPVELDGVDTLHAPFFAEGRIRGLVQCCVAGNPGTLRSG